MINLVKNIFIVTSLIFISITSTLLPTISKADAILKDLKPIKVPQGLTQQNVKTAIFEGMKVRKWYPEKQEPGKIVAVIDVRGIHKVKETITYDDKMITITYLDSTNMRYRIGQPETDEWTEVETQDDVPLIHRRYYKWVSNLANDIKFQLRKLEAINSD